MSTVIYARQSLDRDGEGAAVDRQLAECQTLAQAYHLDVTATYIDNDVSATRGVRPAFQQLLEAIDRGEVSTIIAWHTDRLYRRTRDLLELIERAEKHPIRLLTLKAGDLDLTNPAGRMMAGMLANAARYEIESKSSRQVAANIQRARKGDRHFAKRPYGYDRVNGEIFIVEDEAQVMREAIGRVIAGESWYAVAKDYRERGVVGLTGVAFSPQNLMQRCTNPALAGVRTYLGDVVNESGNWPPIIDRATWQRLENVTANRRRTKTWESKIKYLGSGIYRCGKCGAVMRVAKDYNNGRISHPAIYQCPTNFDTRRNLASVDALVEAATLERLSQPDVLALISPSEDASLLAAESNEIRERIGGLAELYADGILTGAAVREQKIKLQARLDTLQGRLEAIEGGSALHDLVSADNVEKFWRESMSLRSKRQIVDALFTVTIMPTQRGGTNTFRPEDVVIEPR